MGQNNDRDYEGATAPFDAQLSQAKQESRERAWHPDCAVCQTKVCLRLGHFMACSCHGAESGVERGSDAVHSGQCLVVFIKARAMETVASLVKDVAAGLRVWRDRDKMPLTDAQVSERAVNIVAGIVGNYDVVSLERVAAVGTHAKEIG